MGTLVMVDWLSRMRHAAHPRSLYRERGQAKPPRASSIILGMTLVMLALVLLAKVLTAIFTV